MICRYDTYHTYNRYIYLISNQSFLLTQYRTRVLALKIVQSILVYARKDLLKILEEFTPARLKTLREKGYKAVALIRKPDQIIIMPLKTLEEEERLKFLNIKQVGIHEPELEDIALRSGISDHIKIQFSDDFKLD